MIKEHRLIQRFQKLVSIDNPTYKEREMCDYIKSLLDEWNITYTEDLTGEHLKGTCGNLYAYIEGDLDLPPLLFSAHMDAVDPAVGKHAVIHKDGMITSNGNTVLAADDLSAIAVILEAIRSIKEDGLPHRPLELVFSVAEETYCEGIKHFDFSQIKSKECYVLDLTGSIGSAAYMAPTILSFKANFHGRASHAAFSPEDGIHSILAAAHAVHQISCGRVEDTTVNIGTIHGGTADNVVPENCTLTGEVRSFSDEHAHRQYHIIEEQLQKSAALYHAKLTIEKNTLFSAYEVSLEDPVITRFRNACKKNNLEVNLINTFGGSDNNVYAVNGIKGIVIASGMNRCHSCQEYTTISDLMEAAELTQALMLSTDEEAYE